LTNNIASSVINVVQHGHDVIDQQQVYVIENFFV